MGSLPFIFFAASIVLAGSILYFYFSGAMQGVFKKPVVPAAPPEDASGRHDGVRETLMEEIRGVKLLAAELRKRQLDLEWSERQIDERIKKLDSLIESADETMKKASLEEHRMKTDKYARAGLLLEMGLPPEEVKCRLGLLEGEAELIESLGGYRV